MFAVFEVCMSQIDILVFLCIRRKQTSTMFAANQASENVGFFGVLGSSFEFSRPYFSALVKQLLGNEFFINMRKIAFVIIHYPIVKWILQNISKLSFGNRIAALTISQSTSFGLFNQLIHREQPCCIFFK